MVKGDNSEKTAPVGGEKAPPPPTKTPGTSEESAEEDIDDDPEAKFKERVTSQIARKRLYSAKKPDQPAKKELPKLDDRDYLMLKEHVRLLKGKSPRAKRSRRIVCWNDDPEIAPKNNLTSKVRTKRIQENLADRKDSEEDPFSARCTY